VIEEVIPLRLWTFLNDRHDKTEIRTDSGVKLGLGGLLVLLCGGFVGALLALPIAVAFYELGSLLEERLSNSPEVHRSLRVGNFILRSFVFVTEAGLSVLCALISLSGYRSPKYKLVTLASLIGIALPGALIVDLLIKDPIIKELFDSPVSFFDHTWPPQITSANLLAIATGLTGAVTLLSHRYARTLTSAAAITCAASFVTAWLASSLGVRFGYVLTLLAIQATVAFALASVFRRHSHERRTWSKYSISDILALTVVVAIATASLGHMHSAVLLETKIMYWVFLLGGTVGVLSSLLSRSTFTYTTYFVLAVLAATFVAAILTTSAFMSLATLRLPNCNYDVEAGVFTGFRHGYFHWFLLHCVIQMLVILTFTRCTHVANPIATTGKLQ